MEREFKHPQIFADMLVFCQLYYPMHNNLPKPFRFAVGERILAESAECLRAIVLAKQGVANPQVEQFRWMLEELRVQLFAQELRTPVPVSVKRLEKQWEGIKHG